MSAGEFNARVQIRQEGEEQNIGEHTFCKENATIEFQIPEVAEKRVIFKFLHNIIILDLNLCLNFRNIVYNIHHLIATLFS